MLNLTYLSCLLLALGGLAVLDARYRLVLWRARRRAVALIIAGVSFFLAWDIGGITLGIFHVGNAPFLAGLRLAPELPVEEVVFLTLLLYQTLIIWTALEKRYAR